MRKASGVVAMAMALVALPAMAHHSFAVYDMVSVKSADATIKEFHFGAPHSAMRFVITGANGKPQDLALIGAAPTALMRAGFKPQDFSKGTKVRVTWHPVRNGAPEGTMLSITLPGGRVFTDGEVRSAGGSSPSAGGADASGPSGAATPQ